MVVITFKAFDDEVLGPFRLGDLVSDLANFLQSVQVL